MKRDLTPDEFADLIKALEKAYYQEIPSWTKSDVEVMADAVKAYLEGDDDESD